MTNLSPFRFSVRDFGHSNLKVADADYKKVELFLELSLTTWFLGLWKWFVGGMWTSLEL